MESRKQRKLRRVKLTFDNKSFRADDLTPQQRATSTLVWSSDLNVTIIERFILTVSLKVSRHLCKRYDNETSYYISRFYLPPCDMGRFITRPGVRKGSG
ncbi:MAG: hypothetical protein OEW40_15830, partial [Cyclobacteriaceae bacterium]|nr:hypothetical protein [Cyclobacteriaceae bacterium]